MASTNAPRLAAGIIASVLMLAGCAPDSSSPTNADRAARVSLARAGYDQAGAHRQYGPAIKVGDGMARSYVVVDSKQGGAPLELGVALDAQALDGLPRDMMMYMYILKLPALAPAPYQFIELDWNPMGHEPPNVYTVPHFDFHFYTMSLAEHNSIVPSDPDFAAKANNVPTGGYVPAFFVPLAGPGGTPADVAVPQMGVHWSDVRSPELQGLLGHPENVEPFTKTFIYGSWNGRFTFYEPMITVDYLRTRPDVTTPIPVPALYPQSGYFPTAYKVTYDAQAREYRVALSGLTARP